MTRVLLGAIILGGLIIVLQSILIDSLDETASNSESLPSGEKGLSTQGQDPKMPKILIPGDAYKYLFIFLQISDLHISQFHDPGRIQAFREFCNVTIDTIKPSAVIASGDLTDGKYRDGERTDQFEEEWIHYRKALEDFKVPSKTMWMDVRGNHDNFNVRTTSSSYYKKYSVQGGRNGSSYVVHIVPKIDEKTRRPSEKYSFIAVDAGLQPGPKAPWNFFGNIPDKEFEQLYKFADESKDSNGIIYFGHYPTSCVYPTHSQNMLRNLMTNSDAYLCGHLHTMFGFANEMYKVHFNNGLVELELADFKVSRRIRLAAFDHGSLSFIDETFNKWPMILLTNPKNAYFTSIIDATRMRSSSHIRMLVFSTSKIQFVKFRIDEGNWNTGSHVEASLYIGLWNPMDYATGLHSITVVAWDADGRNHEITQSFSLDGNKPTMFNTLGETVLGLNALTPYCIFLIASLCVTLPVFGVRTLHSCVKSGKILFRTIVARMGRCCLSALRKLWIVTTINKLYFPLILGPLYWPFGPWFEGEMLRGSNGWGFAWGTYVDGKWLPAAVGYLFDGIFQICWFHLPFMIVLCHCVDRKFRTICWREPLSSFWTIAPLPILWVVQVLVARLVYVTMDLSVLYLGQLQKYSIAYGVILWFFMVKLQRQHFQEAESVWKKPVPDARYQPSLIARNPS